MTKSIRQVNIKDGEYKATWSGFNVEIIRPITFDWNSPTDFKNGGLAVDVEVNRGIKGTTRKKIEVIDGWVYVDLSVEDRRELKLKKILE